MNADLADSSLHAPGGSWNDEDYCPDFIDKAAVPLVRLAKNHPLLDGNKRAAWVTLRLFVEMNGWTWRTNPGVDEAERAVLAVSSSEWDEERTSAWLRPLLGAHRTLLIGDLQPAVRDRSISEPCTKPVAGVTGGDSVSSQNYDTVRVKLASVES